MADLTLGGKILCEASEKKTSVLVFCYRSSKREAEMHKTILLVVNGFFLIEMSSSSFVNIDNSLNPGEVKQNQVFFNRKERFIKFDTKDNELDVSGNENIFKVKSVNFYY